MWHFEFTVLKMEFTFLRVQDLERSSLAMLIGTVPGTGSATRAAGELLPCPPTDRAAQHLNHLTQGWGVGSLQHLHLVALWSSLKQERNRTTTLLYF